MKELWAQGGCIIDWVPQKADSDMKISKQEAYWDVFGSHSCEPVEEVGLGRWRRRTAIQSLQGVLELAAPFRVIPSLYSIIRSLHQGWSRAPTLPGAGVRRAGQGIYNICHRNLDGVSASREWKEVYWQKSPRILIRNPVCSSTHIFWS